MASMSVAQLRGALARYREQVRFGRFPDDLREQAVTYTQERLRAGAEPAVIASELGVTATTVGPWVKQAARSAPAAPLVRAGTAPVTMVPLMVRPAPEAVAGARLEVAFPDGTKLQVVGMAGRDVVDAITVLRGTR